MRRLLIEALDFPRRYIRSNLNLIDCLHGGNFQRGDQRCESCLQKDSCRWLYFNDECANSGSKSASELIRSLEFSLDCVDTNMAQAGHHIGTCACDTCLWLKNAENLLSLYHRNKTNCH